MRVRVENVKIFKCANSLALEADIGHANIEASFVTALKESIPLHNKDWDEFPTTLAAHLKKCNVGHWLVTDKCFMETTYVRCHERPPTQEQKLIIPEKLTRFEVGAECEVITIGGYDDGVSSSEHSGWKITNIVPGEFVRHMEFIFDTSRRYLK
jgi:hypothetical protein